ncbi:MAG TPA: S8 family serine peptidase, partial [Candidatus Acidoferrales bacterium]
MTITRPSRVWFTCVSLILFAAVASAPVFAQNAPPTNTDLKFHKFVPPTPPENNASASAARQATTPDAVDSAAVQQMQLLLQEKSSRTPAQQKIDSNILYTIRMMSGQPAAPGFQSLYTGVDLDDSNRIAVDIIANVTPELLQQLQTAGALVQDSHPEYRSIRALIPANQIVTIAASPDVSFIGRKVRSITSRLTPEPKNYVLRREAFAPGFEERAANVRKQIATYLQQQQQRPVANSTTGVINTGQGSVTTEGDATHLAARARGVFGINGSGLKIGVLSDSANDTGAATAAQATGDLPPTCPGPGGPCLTILQDSPGQDGTDEGTAMMEIVYDMAPGASLYFATANISESGFAANILALQAAGCNIIVDDVAYFDEPVFQDGMVAQAVNTVTAAGALYFSSAGNEGNVDAGTAGYFEGDFNDTGSQSFPDGAKTGTLHNFGTGFAGDPITSPGEGYVLQWADPFGASGNDYDLFYLNSSGIIVASSTNIQNGTQNPFEFINPPVNANPGDQLVVFKTTAAARLLFALKTFRGTLSVATAGETWGHSAAVAAFSVAAAPAAAAFTTGYPAGPFPNPFTASNLLEPFTSDGPRRIIFNADGSAITPGNFSSTGGTVRSKPDITAADGVSTTLPSDSGLNPFYGTSAAAPHAASIAALIMSAKPALTPAQIRTTLTSTALDIMAPGYDRDSGNGIVMAYPALNSLGLTPGANPEILSVVANENPGNGNGIIDPGEGALLSIQLKNPFGVVNATGITGVLTTNTPGVTVTQPAVSAFPDIAAGSGTGGNLSPFTFTVASNVPCALNIQFTLTLTYTGGPTPTKALNFSVQTGVISITNSLGNSAPAGLPAGATFATGSQTNRLSRNGVPTTCESGNNFPGIIATGQRTFDSYTFTSFHTGCSALSLTSPDGADLFTSLYQPNFVPSNLETNYLADSGASGSPQGLSVFAISSNSYAFVVNDSSPNGTATGTNYTLQIPSCLLTNPGTINQVPVVQVQDVTVAAATIGGAANASIDNGSFSPSGDAITETQTPPGPYPQGVTNVTLTVVDSKGATAQASANVTVTNPPEPDMTVLSSHLG